MSRSVSAPKFQKPQGRLIFCRRCSYVLNYVAEARCPECGTEFSLADPRSYLTTLISRTARRVSGVLACVLLLLGLFNIVVFFVVPNDLLIDAVSTLDPVPSWTVLWIWLPLNSLGPLILGGWMAWRGLRGKR